MYVKMGDKKRFKYTDMIWRFKSGFKNSWARLVWVWLCVCVSVCVYEPRSIKWQINKYRNDEIEKEGWKRYKIKIWTVFYFDDVVGLLKPVCVRQTLFNEEKK